VSCCCCCWRCSWPLLLPLEAVWLVDVLFALFGVNIWLFWLLLELDTPDWLLDEEEEEPCGEWLWWLWCELAAVPLWWWWWWLVKLLWWLWWSFSSFKLPVLLLLLPLSFIRESSSGEHEDESSSRLEWFRRCCWSPLLELLPPDVELLPPLLFIFCCCLDFSCWRHFARRFLNHTY